MQTGGDGFVNSLIQSRFDAYVATWPVHATSLGLHQHDGRLPVLSREANPARRVIVATDAIWRAARIVLDMRLHRGETGVEEAVDFLVEHTRFERPVATAEVHRYTQSPGYNLSYLLGKVLLLRLRTDEQARQGDAFSLKGFHDALLYSGNMPLSFHRRLLAGEGGGPTRPGPLGD